MAKIDLKDKRIMKELDMNARMPLTQLSKKVALSRQVVEYRLKKLQEDQIIFKALPIFDSIIAGYNWYRVILRLMHISKEEKEKLLISLKENPYTLWVGEVGGNWDLIINYVCKDNFEFNKLFESLTNDFGQYIQAYEVLIYINVHDLERNYLLEEKRIRREMFHEMKFNPKIKLDNLDKNIIKSINQNAWISNLDLGEKLKVSANTIKNRLDEMIKNKLLLGFRLLINPNKIGYVSHMILLETNYLDQRKEAELYYSLKNIKNITFLVKHMGKWKFGMEIETQSEEEFQNIFSEIRNKFSDIISGFEAFPILKDHKINYFPEGNLQ